MSIIKISLSSYVELLQTLCKLQTYVKDPSNEICTLLMVDSYLSCVVMSKTQADQKLYLSSFEIE